MIMRPIYYEPRHDEHTIGQVRAALAERGYVPTGNDDVALAVVAEPGGALTLCDGDWGTDLAPVDRWETPADYAGAIADWIASESGDVATHPGERDPEPDEPRLHERRESTEVVSRSGLNFDLGVVMHDLDCGVELPDSVLRVLAQLGVGPGTPTTTEDYERRLAAIREARDDRTR